MWSSNKIVRSERDHYGLTRYAMLNKSAMPGLVRNSIVDSRKEDAPVFPNLRIFVNHNLIRESITSSPVLGIDIKITFTKNF